MSYLPTTEFLINVKLGLVPGYSLAAVVSRHTSVGTDFEDIWGGSSDFVFPTAAESWEVVSDNANDSAAGTGARTVTINSLAADYSEQSPETVSLNGTTPVAIPGTHFRPNNLASTRALFCATAGSSNTNEGTITLRVAGGGNPRAYILPGAGINEDGLVTAPLNKTLLSLKVILGWGKNQDGGFLTKIIPPVSNPAHISSGELSLYQNTFDLTFRNNFATNPTTDTIKRSKAAAAGYNSLWIQEYLIVDSSVIPGGMAMNIPVF